jgi:outer membrane lipoprotein LolB
MRGIVFAALLTTLAGCAGWPGFARKQAPVVLKLAPLPPAFRVEGRVSVKTEDQSFSGGMVWRHGQSSEDLLLRSPLGQGVAELRGGPAGMELEDSEGHIHQAKNADDLIQQVLGMTLPIHGLTWWIVGYPSPDEPYRARPDDAGLLADLDQDGWHIEFSRYSRHGIYQVPGKLVASRGEDLAIRLVVDQWELP